MYLLLFDKSSWDAKLRTNLRNFLFRERKFPLELLVEVKFLFSSIISISNQWIAHKNRPF